MEEKRQELIIKVEEALKALHNIYPDYDIKGEHNKETGRRIADTWIEICKGYDKPDFNFTTFNNDVSYQPIILKDIPFSSFCTHHFLPFSGKVHIGYIPQNKICGLSKLPRVVEYYASKPQIQEIMTNEIAMYLNINLEPILIVVVAEAKHTCVACRGIKSSGGKMITKSVHGDYRFSTIELGQAEKSIMELLK